MSNGKSFAPADNMRNIAQRLGNPQAKIAMNDAATLLEKMNSDMSQAVKDFQQIQKEMHNLRTDNRNLREQIEAVSNAH